MKTILASAILFAASSSLSLAADAPNRVKKPTAPVSESQSCKETSGLPTDVFGFTTGSDVGDYKSLSGALEYNGNYGTRFGKLYGHLAKAQISYVPFHCLEIGPTIQGLSVSADRSTFGLDTRQFGGTVEMKYKILGRATHGIGLTITSEPGVFSRQYNSGFLPVKPSGNVVSNLARVLIDFELVKDKLFGAINLEHSAVWDRPILSGVPDTGYARLSNVNIRAALAYKVSDTFYLGAEASHQRAYTGIFMKNDLGNAWFAGPTFYWQATEKLSLTGAYNYQLAGQTNGFVGTKGVDLINFNRHQAKLKLGYSF